jgi:hypothetical protein
MINIYSGYNLSFKVIISIVLLFKHKFFVSSFILRLISKFGSSVEPMGVDALLKSLGFHHARSTIPKWFQRGLLDNLDEVMQQLIKVYLKLLSDYDLSSVNQTV